MMVVILIIFIIFSLFISISNHIEIKKYKISHLSENNRIDMYKGVLITGMIFLIIIGLLIIFKVVTIEAIFISSSVIENNFLRIIIYVSALVMLLKSLYQITSYLISARSRTRSTNKVIQEANSKIKHQAYVANVLIPRTFKEKVWFTLVSICAGVYEEIVWRGLLIYCLISVFPNLSILIILLISSLLFGIAHSYQGIIGIIITGLVGLLLGGLFIISNSLFLSILMHFLIDFTNNFLYYKYKQKR